MEKKNIAILGLGWLGKALALNLRGHYIVKGSVTSEPKVKTLNNLRIGACIYSLGEPLPLSLSKCDVYIVTIPPTGKNYKQDITDLVKEIPNNAKMIYISSSSVYPNNNTFVKEEEAVDRVSPHSGISLLQIENIFREAISDASIIRMTGLYGPGRHPGNFLAGKTDLKGAKSPVNLVHLDDCVGVIKAVISKGCWGETFNACSDIHPSRKEFYEKATAMLNLHEPEFNGESLPYKLVDNTKSKEVLGYKYQHPDPMKTVELV